MRRPLDPYLEARAHISCVEAAISHHKIRRSRLGETAGPPGRHDSPVRPTDSALRRKDLCRPLAAAHSPDTNTLHCNNLSYCAAAIASLYSCLILLPLSAVWIPLEIGDSYGMVIFAREYFPEFPT